MSHGYFTYFLTDWRNKKNFKKRRHGHYYCYVYTYCLGILGTRNNKRALKPHRLSVSEKCCFKSATAFGSRDLRTPPTTPRPITYCDADEYATSCAHAFIDRNRSFCLLKRLYNKAFVENTVYCGPQCIQQTNKSTLKTEALLCWPHNFCTSMHAEWDPLCSPTDGFDA